MSPSGFLTAPSFFTVGKLPCDCYATQKTITAFKGTQKARPQLYACARKAFAKRRSRQNLLNTLSFPHNKNFPPVRGFINKGAHETRGNRLQNALFMRILRAGTNFFLYRPHYPLPPHSITAPLVARTYSALARII